MKILVPLDGSDVSLSILPAVRRVLEPAFRADSRIAGYIAAMPSDEPVPPPPPMAEVHLLTVLSASESARPKGAPAEAPEGHHELPAETRARVERQARDELEAIARKHFPEARTAVHVEWSRDAAATIGRFAVDLDVDAIAMATHGRSGVSRFLAGSVAERVIRDSCRPVIVQHPAV